MTVFLKHGYHPFLILAQPLYDGSLYLSADIGRLGDRFPELLPSFVLKLALMVLRSEEVQGNEIK